MGFNSKIFMETKFEARREAVAVPQLKMFFDDEDKAVWTVRGLSGAELGHADEKVQNSGISAAILKAVMENNSQEVVEKVTQLMGNVDDKPQATAKRIYHLVKGSVDPVCTLELAVKVCDNYPIIFYELTNKILTLSGEGFSPGKLKPFGKTKK